MSGINKVILLGRLGKDPTQNQISEGTFVTKFSIATSEKYKKEGQEVEKTEWHNISCFGKLAEVTAKYLTKGKQIYVEGKIRTDKYEKDGVTKYATYIVADKVEFLGTGVNADETATEEKQTETKAPYQQKQSPKPNVKNYADDINSNDEIPF